MRFIRTEGFEKGIADLTARLVSELEAGKRVLWLTSGGSNIPASVQIMRGIPDELISNLTVMPNDERYGEVGHTDSNWQQLQTAGFQAKRAKLLPVLQDGLGFEETAKNFEEMARQAFADNDLIITQLGMGPDGHVSGILPGSPAAIETGEWVIAYEAPPLKRITLAFPALSRVTAAYLFAFGSEKLPALENLRDKDLPLSEQPAQILKQIPESYVYNDQLGDAA